MSYKMQEYICKGESCKLHMQVVERFIERGLEDFEECEECHRPIHYIISAPNGYVKGSENYCRGSKKAVTPRVV